MGDPKLIFRSMGNTLKVPFMQVPNLLWREFQPTQPFRLFDVINLLLYRLCDVKLGTYFDCSNSISP